MKSERDQQDLFGETEEESQPQEWTDTKSD